MSPNLNAFARMLASLWPECDYGCSCFKCTTHNNVQHVLSGAGEQDLVAENKRTVGQKADCEATIHKLEAEVSSLKMQVDTAEKKEVAANAAKATAVKDKVEFSTASACTCLSCDALKKITLKNIHVRMRPKHRQKKS